MTQQQPGPGQPGDQPPAGPPGRPPTGWTPAPLSDGARPSMGAEPAAPSGQGTPLRGQAQPSVQIEEFAPPRSRLPLLVIVIALVVAGLIWAGTTMRAPQQPTPAASHSASPSATASAAPGLPFVTPDQDGAGRWEILQHKWTDSGLEAEVRIAADRGPITYSFVAFGNNDVEATASEPGSQEPHFSDSPIATGQEETGWLFFPLERGATTIILSTAGGNQMSALPVAG